VWRNRPGAAQPTFERAGQILAGLGWRPRIELEPIADHEAEPRRLFQAERQPIDARLEDAASWMEFERIRGHGPSLTSSGARSPIRG
jgi:hypothetical protein